MALRVVLRRHRSPVASDALSSVTPATLVRSMAYRIKCTVTVTTFRRALVHVHRHEWPPLSNLYL